MLIEVDGFVLAHSAKAAMAFSERWTDQEDGCGLRLMRTTRLGQI
jgi:hypothetical protein